MLRALVAPLLLAGVVQADDAVDYLRDVKPILAGRCVSCHGTLKQKNGLRLDTAFLAKQGGTSGPALVAGKSAESLLIEHVTGANGAVRMPPEGEPLTEKQIDVLKRWIDQGAVAPDEKPGEDPARHWAFVPPVRPEVPQRPDMPAGNPVDAFLAAELHARGLQPLGEASKAVLLRRVSLDLIGLPPTPAELEAFVNDASPDAYDKVVDQLLASPHYGERWGRHWMDVWRYSDWDGYQAEVRESQPHVWRWRDWIIESLNQDKPYDRMVQEMLAGDELAPGDPQTVRATGFLVRNWFKFNRNVWLDASVEHTSKAFLGATINCARCHDHMYDPFGQDEYYRMRAFFEPHDVRIERMPGQPDLTKDGLVHVYDANAATPTYLFHRGEEKQPDKDHPLTPGVPEILTRYGNPLPEIAPVPLPPAMFYPGSREFEQNEAITLAEAEAVKARAVADESRKAVELARQKAVEFAARTQGLPRRPDFTEDFSIARPDVWTYGPGNWEYREGRLVHQTPVASFSKVALQQPLPVDFVARLRFKTLDAGMWKSVGLSFDQVDDANFDGVYLSAYAAGPTLQVIRRRNGVDTHPAMKALPVELNREYELQVFVRGQQLNVGLDGKLLAVYTLPDRIGRGPLALWTYDAAAEFLSLRVDALTPDVTLATAEDQPLPVEPTLESIRRAVVQAEQSAVKAETLLAVADASLAFARARREADLGRYAQPPVADSEARILAAGKAERELAVKKADLALGEAEQKLAAARAVMPATEPSQKAVMEAEAAVAAARKGLDDAQAAVAQPNPQYTRLGTVYPETSTGRRLGLAKWITARTNPLAARVAVNQIWMRHFHQPLVSSVFEFGLNGKRPSHPALLDWLAVELMDSGWKMKPLHRLIVTSQAYQRSSGGAESGERVARNRAIDPENVWLWRMNARRLEAELVRDCTLFAAGSLDPAAYGPDLDPAAGLTLGRRSVYFRSAKEKKMTFLALFDSANVLECYRRSESIVPQQALAMANSPLSLSQSRVLAASLSKSVGTGDDSDAKFIDRAFAHILSRTPGGAEQSECLKFLADQAARFSAQANLTAFTSGDAVTVRPSADPRQRARENLVHVLLNHNDFVTVR